MNLPVSVRRKRNAENCSKYYFANKEDMRKRNKRWQDAHRDICNAAIEIAHNRWREAWMFFVESFGFTSCSRCGYDKSFAAINFHHVEPEKKEFEFCWLFGHKPTTERLQEFEKVIPLCANCHIEVHEELREIQNGTS